MNLFSGMTYNLRGLWLGIRTPRLLVLGLIRFAVIIVLAGICASLIWLYHNEILNLIWSQPESRWILWLWHLFSWLLSLLLMGVAAVVSYLLGQILFSVVIMDTMSQITEIMITGQEKKPEQMSLPRRFLYLIKQEIPRTIFPVTVTLLIMGLGWLTPLAPILAVVSSGVAVLFLAWDNTDLVPARRLVPFRNRLKILLKTLPFHLGFGLLFLVPGLNILLLSFAPVGATLYHLDHPQL